MQISTIFAFLFALGILITIHELGHYFVARLCDVKVLKFSIGMGKVIYSRRFGQDQTEWAISILPLGGYVKMLDSRESDNAVISEQDKSREFTQKSVWKRIAIVAAGPIANFLLAILLFSSLYLHGLPDATSKIRVASEHSFAYQYGLRHGDVINSIDGEEITTWSAMRNALLANAVDKKNVLLQVTRKSTYQLNRLQQVEIKLPLSRITSEQLEGDFLKQLGLGLARPLAVLKIVKKNGPADRAGLQVGDQVLKVNNKNLIDGQEFAEIVSVSPNKSLYLLVKSGEKEFAVDVTPELVVDDGKSVGRIQVELDQTPELITVSASPWQALTSGVAKTWDTSMLTFTMLGKMVTGEVSLKNITGPITIADYAGQTARLGIISYISFIALISISLGVMNLLPIPVLDGGHLLYYSLEVLMGKPVPEKYIEIMQRGGMLVLLSLMAVAFFNDIVRLMS
jgi:regulator of sigma E protease